MVASAPGKRDSADVVVLAVAVIAYFIASSKAEGAQAMLESRRGDIDKVFGDLSETMSSVRELTEELRANPSLLIRERVPEPLPETER